MAGTASIAAVAAVIMTHSAALADVAGAHVHATAIVIPMTASAAPSVTPAIPAPVATAPTVAPEVEAPVSQPEVESAPQADETVAEEPVVTTVATAPSAATEEAVVASAALTGTWDAAYEWCKNHGWTSLQTSEWISRLEGKLQQFTAQPSGTRVTETSGLDHDGLKAGSQKDRSPDSPDHSD